jgi:hypothetical protein
MSLPRLAGEEEDEFRTTRRRNTTLRLTTKHFVDV